MSYQAINAVKFAAVSPTQKLVLFALADCHNSESGRCDPSVAYLMEITGLSNRAIATSIAALELGNHVFVSRSFGARSTYLFRVLDGSIPSKPVNDVPKPVNLPHPSSTFTSEPNSQTSESASGAPVNLLPKPVNEVHTNNKEQEKNKKKQGKLDSPFFDDSDSAEFQSAMSAWFEFKKQRGDRYVQSGWQAILTTQRRFTVGQVKLSVEASMGNGWQGLFTDKITTQQAEAFEPKMATQAPADDESNNPNYLVEMMARRIAQVAAEEAANQTSEPEGIQPSEELF